MHCMKQRLQRHRGLAPRLPPPSPPKKPHKTISICFVLFHMILLGGRSQDLFMCNGYADFVPCVCDKLAKVCVCCVSCSAFVPCVCDKLAKVCVCCVCCYLQVLFHMCVISWPKSVCVVFAVTFRFCSICV